MLRKAMTRAMSNPFATSGGGITFEQMVGSYYLVSLLASDIPRGCSGGMSYSVAFQRRWSDALLDDIVVTTRSTNNIEYRLFLQVKHDITISKAQTNVLFRQVMGDCWAMFQQGNSGFNPDRDRIGIAAGIYTKAIDEQLQKLLQWARTTISIEEFQRIKVQNFSSSEMRDYLDVFETILSELAGRKVLEEELWQFLKCFVYIYFDIENEDGHDQVYLRQRTSDQLMNRDPKEVKKLLDSLQVLVSTYAKTGGAVDATTLRSKLDGFSLTDRIDCRADLERLRNHSERTLSRINTTIGQKVYLPRTDVFEEVLDAIYNNEFVFILGEPGGGKSVLLSTAVNHLRQEGEILATSINSLSGSNIEEFLANLQIDHDFSTLLGSFSAAPFRCLFIDQLEQALFDEDRRKVLYDLIYEVRQYNERISKVSKTAQWRIVATCRADQYYPLLLSLRQVIHLPSSKIINVPPLDTNDVALIVDIFPSFRHLSEQQHIQHLLRNPFILDFLTFPELKLVDLPQPVVLTESWLVKLYWMQIIRNSEGAGTGRGNPEAREQTTLLLGQSLLRSRGKPAPLIELNPEIVDALRQDRVIHNDDGLISFVHDTLNDWTAFRLLLLHRNRLIEFLQEHQETMQLIKPMSLLALRQLEFNQVAEEWLELLKA
jgi:hypothetical protein